MEELKLSRFKIDREKCLALKKIHDEEDRKRWEDADAARKAKTIVIGICGKPGAGKDTLGLYLKNNFGFDIFALKNPIEEVVQAVFNVDDLHLYDREFREQPLPSWPGWTVRKMLQAVGQSMRDIAGGDVWAKSLCQRIDDCYVVLSAITDVRTPEDVKYIREHVESQGGRFILIMVKRPGFGATTSGGFKNHKLESYDLESECDAVFENNGTKDELFEQAKEYFTFPELYNLGFDSASTLKEIDIGTIRGINNILEKEPES